MAILRNRAAFDRCGGDTPGGRGTLAIMDYTGRLHSNGVPFSGWRYIKG